VGDTTRVTLLAEFLTPSLDWGGEIDWAARPEPFFRNRMATSSRRAKCRDLLSRARLQTEVRGVADDWSPARLQFLGVDVHLDDGKEGLDIDLGKVTHVRYDARREAPKADPAFLRIEISSCYGRDRSVPIPYGPAFDRHDYKNFYYGASTQAMTRMAARKGYRLVATEPRGHDAYFLRADVGTRIPARPPADAWRLHDKYEKRRTVQREGIQLVEVE
jgi:hypothetical protein